MRAPNIYSRDAHTAARTLGALNRVQAAAIALRERVIAIWFFATVTSDGRPAPSTAPLSAW